MIGIGVRQNRIGFGGVTPPPVWDNTYSLDFDGVDDYVNCGTGIGDSLGDNYTGDLSLSMWFKADLTTGNDGFFTIGDFSSSTGEFTISLYSNEIYYRLNQGGWTRKVAFTDTSSWHHLLIIYKSGSEADSKMFLDGTAVGSTSGSFPATSVMDFAGLKTIIGAYYTNAYGWNGLIDEVAVWSNDQTANAATIYGSGTPGNLTDLSPLAWWRCGDSGLFFNSNWEIPEQTKIDNFSSHSMEFDGVDDGINCGNDASLQITGDITVSGWFKLTSANAAYISSKGYYGNGTISWALYIIGSGGGCGFDYYGGATVGTRIYNQYTSAVNDGEWHHIAGVKSGSTSILYLDGSVVGSPSGTQANIYNSSNDVTIGFSDNNANWFPGSLDCISVWDAALDASTITSIYNAGEPNNLTLAASYTAGGGIDKSGDLQGYWLMGEDATWDGSDWTIPDDSTNSNDGTSSGMAEEDKQNTAPDNVNQGLSSGMVEGDRVEDTP
jgi:hypothetical protein